MEGKEGSGYAKYIERKRKLGFERNEKKKKRKRRRRWI